MPATPAWQKSSFSGSGDGNNCVEIAALDGAIRLRESDETQTVLAAAPTALAAMLRQVKGTDFGARAKAIRAS